VTGCDVAHVSEVASLLPPGDIHLVRNAGTELAISRHVYGASLTNTRTNIRAGTTTSRSSTAPPARPAPSPCRAKKDMNPRVAPSQEAHGDRER
jgi:hypothetical protein